MAAQLGVPQKWLREQAEAGTIPHLAAGSRLLFDPEVVEPIMREMAGRKPAEVKRD